MALVIEVAETFDGVIVSRGGEQVVLRTFGLRDGKLLLGLDYGRPQLAELGLELGCWHSMKLFGVEFKIITEFRRANHLALVLQADRSLNFQRLSAKKGVAKAP
jgi:hypothetical protein